MILAFSSIFGVAAVAQAASAVTVTTDGLTTDTIQDGVNQEVKFHYEVAEPAEAPVSFTVDIPEGLTGSSETIQLKGEDGEQYGQCTVEAQKMTCTLDDDYVKENPYGIAGDVTMRVHTDFKNKDDESHTFDWGDVTDEVTVTPNPNWCFQDCEYKGQGNGKWGSYNNADDTIIWTVQVKAPADGIAAGSHITVTDNLDADKFEMISNDGYPKVFEGGHLYYNEWDRQTVRYAQKASSQVLVSDDSKTVEFGAVAGSATQGADGDTVTEGSFYYVQFKTRVKDEGKAGKYENSATVKVGDDDSSDTSGSATRYENSGTVVGKNFGKFRVTKELTGDTTLNPEFTVNYTSELDGVTKDGSFKIRAGATYTSGEFFKGTTVTLNEVKPTSPDNVTWATPTFLDENGNPASKITFSSSNKNLGQLTEIRLVNKATLKTGQFSARKVVKTDDPVAGGDLNLPRSYTLDYSYGADTEKGFPGGKGQLVLDADGTVVSSPELPVGAKLTLSESAPPVAGATVESTVSPTTVTIGGGSSSDEPVLVTVTNTYTRDTGSFSVKKNLKGTGANTIPEGQKYDVTWSYPADDTLGFPAGKGTLQLTAGAEKTTVNGLPAGAKVTLNEITQPDGDNTSWEPPVWTANGETSAPTFVIVKGGTTVDYDLDNTINFRTGKFSVAKKVAGNGAQKVPDGTEFTVHYSATLPEGYSPAAGDSAPEVEGDLSVKADGASVDLPFELPAGTRVALSEATPAPVAGATWQSPDFSPREFTIKASAGDGTEPATKVTVTNVLALDLGDVAVSKTVDGSGRGLLPSDAIFTLNYSYAANADLGFEAGQGSVKVKGDGTVATIKDLPTGAVVVFDEAEPDKVTGGDWIGAELPDGDRVTVGNNATDESPVTFSLVNVLELASGQFAVTKSVEGSGKDLADPSTKYVVMYNYPAGEGFAAGSGYLEVRADGTAIPSGPLPFGAKVTLTEVPAAAVDGADWAGATFSPVSLTIGEDTTVEVSLVNTLDRHEVPPTASPSTQTPAPSSDTPAPSTGPTVTPSGTPSHDAGGSTLPSTGARVSGIFAVAALIIGAGATMLVASRRKRRH